MGVNNQFSKENSAIDYTKIKSTECNMIFGDRFRFLNSAKPFNIENQYIKQQSVDKSYNYEVPQRRFISFSAKTKSSVHTIQESNLNIEKISSLNNPELEWTRCAKEIKYTANWSKQFEICNTVRRLCLNHPNVLSHSPLLRGFILDLLKLTESKRSNLSKSALVLLGDFFTSTNSAMNSHLEITLPVLIKLGTESGSFLGPHAIMALNKACGSCCENKIVSVLLTIINGSIKVVSQARVRIVQCFKMIIKKLSLTIKTSKVIETIICSLAELISEPSMDVRNEAKEAFALINDEINNSFEFHELLRRGIKSESAYKFIISKILTNRKEDPVNNVLWKPFNGQRILLHNQ